MDSALKDVTDTTAILLGALLFVVIPSMLLGLPLARYGKRHGWDSKQYAWVMLGAGIGWFVVLFGWILKAPIDRVLTIAAMLGVPMAFHVIGLTLVRRSMSRRRMPK